MATCSGKVKVDASQKVRNDHELFLEAYERPTQIYRFLKARHSLEPLFLQRNLSYMKNRRRNKRRKVSFSQTADEAHQLRHDDDISKDIKSDNHLNLSFESICKGEDFMKLEQGESEENDEPFKHGTLLEVEVLLYRFKHPTPESLVTSNPSSLSCESISLGRCVIPYTCSSSCSSPNDIPPKNPTTTTRTTLLSIPGSMLSWRKTNGTLGTHMLAFKVAPVPNGSPVVPEQKAKRKRLNLSSRRKTPPVHSVHQNGISNNHLSSLPNGVIDKSTVTTRKRNKAADAVTCTSDNQKLPENCDNEQSNNNFTPDAIRSVRKKAPGGKTLPSISEKLNISIPRKSLLKLSNRKRSKRNTLESLSNSASDKQQHHLLPETSSDEEDVHKVSSIKTDLTLIKNSRKRNLDHDNDNITVNDEVLPLAKKPCGVNNISRHTEASKPASDTATNNPLTNNTNTESEVYCAELVAFDSRQECLLVDGEYELIMQSTQATAAGHGCDAVDDELQFDRNRTVFTFNDEACKVNKTLTIKFTTKWIPNLPKPRTQELAETAFELLKLRKSYKAIVPSANGTDPLPVPPLRSQTRCPTPCPVNPTLFNFMYNNDRLQQTELKENFTCPWCSLDCKQLYCLLKHMSLCHPRFKFIYNQSDKGLSCVDVKLDKHYDSKRSSMDPVEMMGRDAITVRKRPTKLKPTTLVLVDKYDACESFSLNEFTPRWQLQSAELFRTFYHSQTCLPMLPGELDDSEVESSYTPDWLKTTSMQMVDEFIDVNFGEKQFMKVWNSYVMDYRILADKQVPKLCVDFARDKSHELQEKNIVLNFMSHVTYMCDIGLVPSSVIKEVYRLISPPPPDSSTTLLSRES